MCRCEGKEGEKGFAEAKGRHSSVSGRDRQVAGLKREDRVCKECTRNEVEDVTHWLLRCPAWNSHRQPLLPEVKSHTEDAEGTANLLSLACRNYSILSTIMSMWYARFGKF